LSWRLLAVSLSSDDRSQTQAKPFHKLRICPEHLKDAVEERLMLTPVHQASTQRSMDVFPTLNPDALQCGESQGNALGRNSHPTLA
jgi:hypothetical protein